MLSPLPAVSCGAALTRIGAPGWVAAPVAINAPAVTGIAPSSDSTPRYMKKFTRVLVFQTLAS